jgi:hypothetical protein
VKADCCRCEEISRIGRKERKGRKSGFRIISPKGAKAQRKRVGMKPPPYVTDSVFFEFFAFYAAIQILDPVQPAWIVV